MSYPIKCEFMYNNFSKNDLKKNKKMSKTEKNQSESEITNEQLLIEVNTLIGKTLYEGYTIYSFENIEEINKPIISIKTKFGIDKFNDMVESLNYKKNTEISYGLDFNDAFCCNIINLSFVFFNRLFV